MKRLIEAVFLSTQLVISSLCWSQAKTMSGLVTDKASSQPVEGATVTMTGDKAKSDATTDIDGAFVLNLAQGVKQGDTVRIHIEKPGYKPYGKLLSASSEVPLRISLEPIGKHVSPTKKTPLTKARYDRAHLAVTNIQLWAAQMNSEAMVTVRNIGSKPIVPCAVLRGAIIVSSWLAGAESENRLFAQRPEWQEGGKRQLNCDEDWAPGVEKTFSIKLGTAFNDTENPADVWQSLMSGERLWYVVSRLKYRDSDEGTALPEIESCVWVRAQQPEWVMNNCFGHNDPTVNTRILGSGRQADSAASP
jgi:hypothetical protein